MTEHQHDHDHDHDEHEHHHHDGPHDYVSAIEGYRAEKDAFFRSSPGSPIPAEEREAFTGLPYYPVNVEAVLEGLTLEPYNGNEPTTFQIRATATERKTACVQPLPATVAPGGCAGASLSPWDANSATVRLKP